MLGHNGAGKSSLISILTGLYEPTQGSAEVYGVDMIKDFDKVRSFLGICPQHDVYFDLLTPREHLDIFYDFKGGEQDAAKKKAEVDGLIKSVGLFDQQHDLTSKLSGGYQRKLSCCQALVGGSKLIIMDEPTSSLDLNARRQIWNCLKEYKKDRIVLLTTHYMDEADILGDRIGIMTKGKITCLGSSLFLKRQFGVGYNLAMVKASAAPNTMLESYFQQHLGPKAKKLTEVQTEIIMQVPLDYAPKFQQFFDKFDAMMPEFGIVQYGISITTLEDVFLNVGHLADNEETPTPGSTGKRSSKKRENGRINPDQWDRTSIIDED
jgi:ATP-binding cassette subfamily A (ABC1) protein 3